MPSLAALKLLLTIAVSDSLPLEKGEKRKTRQSFLGFFDVKRSHFYSKATRELYVEIPSEGKKPEDGGVVGRLVRRVWHQRCTHELGADHCRVHEEAGIVARKIKSMYLLPCI